MNGLTTRSVCSAQKSKLKKYLHIRLVGKTSDDKKKKHVTQKFVGREGFFKIAHSSKIICKESMKWEKREERGTKFVSKFINNMVL